MAPPPTPASGTLSQRLIALAQTLQFSWFIGHLTLLLATLRYGFSYLTFNYYSKMAQFSYRLAFLSAAATYGIVVYKAYRARMKSSKKALPQGGALALLADENVQYLLMALVWLFSKQVPLALLPFSIYSTFHFLTYFRTYIISAFNPTPAATNGTTAKSSSKLADQIGTFVKANYENSMFIVALLEVALWFRLLGSAVLFQKGSWILLGIYTVFLRTRIAQSTFISDAISDLTRRADNIMAQQNIPPAAKNAWVSTKGVAKSAHDATDMGRYMTTAQGPPKKAQ